MMGDVIDIEGLLDLGLSLREPQSPLPPPPEQQRTRDDVVTSTARGPLDMFGFIPPPQKSAAVGSKLKKGLAGSPMACEEICPHCGNEGNMSVITRESLVVCTCGYSREGLVVGNSFSDSSRSFVVQRYSYKRSTHFRDTLHNMIGDGDVPADVLGIVRAELKKRRIYDNSMISYQLIRQILRNNGLARYFDSIYSIISAITDAPAIHISEQNWQVLMSGFNSVHQVWGELKQSGVLGARTNMISYSFIVMKLCELIGPDVNDLKRRCVLLKSRDKLRIIDMNWKRLCALLNWRYIPTL